MVDKCECEKGFEFIKPEDYDYWMPKKGWKTLEAVGKCLLKNVAKKWRFVIEDVYKAEASGHFENEELHGWRTGELEYHISGMTVAKDSDGYWKPVGSHSWYNEHLVAFGITIKVQLMRHNDTELTIEVEHCYKIKYPKIKKIKHPDGKIHTYLPKCACKETKLKTKVIDFMDSLHMESIGDFHEIDDLGKKRILAFAKEFNYTEELII